MSIFRKKSKLTNFKFLKTNGPTEIILNDKPLSDYESKTLKNQSLEKIESLLPTGIYVLTIKGGGMGSIKEVAAKKLFLCLDANNKEKIKLLYPQVTKTDTRRVQPKSAGGRKARARTQKSYR